MIDLVRKTKEETKMAIEVFFAPRPEDEHLFKRVERICEEHPELELEGHSFDDDHNLLFSHSDEKWYVARWSDDTTYTLEEAGE